MNRKTDSTPDSPDFKNLVDLLALLADATDRLNDLQTTLNEEQRQIVDAAREDYIELQTKIGDAEAALETLCKRHPEWFKKKKTLTTPYGSAGFRTSSKLIVPDELATITLITAAGRDGDFVRVRRELDLESLEKLGDSELAKFGLIRKEDQVFSAKPGKLDMGKAVKEEAPGLAKAA